MRSGALIAILYALCAGCAEDLSATPEGDPRAGRNAELRGFIYRPDAMAAPGGLILWAQSAISGYGPVDRKNLPANIADLPPSTCRFPAPGASDLVRHVIVERGSEEAPVYQFSRSEVGERAATFVEYYAQSGGKNRKPWNRETEDVMRVVNVAVTEKSAPVYLVLSSETKVLWNILAGPGATISNIALISSEDVGLANAPAGAGVHVLSGRARISCRTPQPMRQPEPDWGFVRNAREDGGAYLNEALQKSNRHASDYARFLRETFGPAAQKEEIAQQGVSNVLIGPAPADAAARVPFRPIGAAQILLSGADYRVIAAAEDYRRAHDAIVIEAARTAAGGALDDLALGNRP